jgi:hypothetical protein
MAKLAENDSDVDNSFDESESLSKATDNDGSE